MNRSVKTALVFFCPFLGWEFFLNNSAAGTLNQVKSSCRMSRYSWQRMGKRLLVFWSNARWKCVLCKCTYSIISSSSGWRNLWEVRLLDTRGANNLAQPLWPRTLQSEPILQSHSYSWKPALMFPDFERCWVKFSRQVEGVEKEENKKLLRILWANSIQLCAAPEFGVKTRPRKYC